MTIFSASSLNMAYKKNTAQSSTQYGEYGGSEHAVDGNRNQLFPAKSCTHTYRSTNPWWWVDLGGEYVVRKVTITVRNDCTTCGKLLQIRDNHSAVTENNYNNNCRTKYFPIGYCFALTHLQDHITHLQDHITILATMSTRNRGCVVKNVVEHCFTQTNFSSGGVYVSTYCRLAIYMFNSFCITS